MPCLIDCQVKPHSCKSSDISTIFLEIFKKMVFDSLRAATVVCGLYVALALYAPHTPVGALKLSV